VTIIEIRPFRNGWKCFEAPGVEPVFPTKDDAISYAQTRARFPTGKIRVLDSNGVMERVIPLAKQIEYCNDFFPLAQVNRL
jgi:hypothetical protein